MVRLFVDFTWLWLIWAAVSTVLDSFFPSSSSLSSSLGVLNSILASIAAGQLYGARHKREISNSQAWLIAVGLTIWSTFIALFLMLIRARFGGEPVLPEGVDTGTLAIFAVATLVSLLVIRFALRWGVKLGARNALKAGK